MGKESAAGFGPDEMPATEDIIRGDVRAAVLTTAAAFSAAFTPPGVLTRIMPTPVGPHPGATVLTQGTFENLVHGFELGRHQVPSLRIPAELLAEVLARVLYQPELYRQFREMGVYAPIFEVDPTAMRRTASLPSSAGHR